MLGTDEKQTKKRIRNVIIIFTAIIITSANQLDKVITHGWTISIKYQQISTSNITQTES